MLKLQSRNTNTHRDRDCHPAGNKTKEGCAPHRLTVLQSLASGNPEEYTLRNLIQSLNSLTSRTTAVLQWIPVHTGLHGNEVADQLTKEGGKKQQPKSKLNYQEAKTLIRNNRLADFKYINGSYNPPTRHRSITYYRATNRS